MTYMPIPSEIPHQPHDEAYLLPQPVEHVPTDEATPRYKTLRREATELLVAHLKLSDHATSLERDLNEDALTGLMNRRALEAEYERVQANLAEDPAQRRIMLVFDFDGFKQVNDTMGHPAGDNLLSGMGDSWRNTLHLRRKKDVFARFGGDEFVMLADATKRVGERNRTVKSAAEKMAHYVEEQAMEVAKAQGAPLKGVSAGWVHIKPGQTFEDAFAIADEMLLENKRTRKAAR